MTLRSTAIFVLALGACSSGRGGGGGGGGGSGDGGTMHSVAPSGPDADTDGDGYTPNQGDCDDSNALVGPADVEINGDGVDNDCDGKADNATSCDSATVGQNTAAALTSAIGICATKFVKATMLNGPSVDEGRDTTATFGVITKLEGSGMGVLSNGLAKVNASYIPQPGTMQDEDTGMDTSAPSPYNDLAAPPNGCGGAPADTGNDYEEVEIDLKIPLNVNSFSFQFQFLSAEYPEFVCSEFNDRFLAIVDDGKNPLQVAFDSSNNPVTVDSGFFTVCTNGTSAQTKHCTTPVSAIMDTGYDNLIDDGETSKQEPAGGSTGWLTTTVPVIPGGNIKLRFVIYDESDDEYDSTVLLDNFKWLAGTTTAPVTIQ